MTVQVKIRSFIRENFLFGSQDKVGDDGSLLEAGVIDSTGAMELVTFLEREFGIAIDDQDLVPENLDSIAAMTSFVARKLAEQEKRNTSLCAAGADR